MNFSIVLLVLLSLHTGCHGLALADPKPDPKADPIADPKADPSYHHTPRTPTGIYETPEPPKPTYLPPSWGTTPPPPPPDTCTFIVNPSLETIPVTETIVLPPVTVMQKKPVVTSYMDMSAITDTVTVIETTTWSTTDTTIPLGPITKLTRPVWTDVSTITFTLTETDKPITETKTREVIKHVPGMPIESTVVLTSTVTQPTMYKEITLDDVTTTTTFPPSYIFVTPTLVSTVILPPHTTTLFSKWVMTHTPPPVIRTHYTVTVTPHPSETTTTLTIPSTVVIPGEWRTSTSTTTSTICKPTYTYPAPSVAFTHGNDYTPNILPIDERTSPTTTTTPTTTTREFLFGDPGNDETDHTANPRGPFLHGPPVQAAGIGLSNEMTPARSFVHAPPTAIPDLLPPVTERTYDYYDYEYEHGTEASF